MIQRHKTTIQLTSNNSAEHMVRQYLQAATTAYYVIKKGVGRVHRSVGYQLYQHFVALVALATVATIGLTAILLFTQRQVQISFAQQTSCNSKLVLLPSLQRVTRSGGYALEFGKKFSLGSLDLISRQLCVTPEQIHPQNTQNMIGFSFLGNPLIEQTIDVTVPNYPSIDPAVLSRPVLAQGVITLTLSTADAIFNYQLEVADKKISCSKTEHNINCSLEELGLRQGEEYATKIVRLFQNNPVEVVFSGKLATAEPVEIIATQPVSGSIVHENVQTMTIETTQILSAYKDVALLRTNTAAQIEIAANVRIEGSRLVIESAELLPRRADYVLKIGDLKAETGGQLDQPFEIRFRTSGGPAVTGVNIGTFGINLGKDIFVSFDQPVDSAQSLTSLIQVIGPAGALSFQARAQGNRIVINRLSLAPCTDYQIRFDNTLRNPYGISGESAWNFRFRTRCAVVSTIGYSINGRPILAYRFGSGASRIMFVGGMHGNEKSSYYTLSAWVDELERYPDRIPAHRTIIVIPNANPDGTAAGRRTNARSVDLNRNFPADDWTSGVYMPGPVFAPEGGGSEPLSEPESAALASYVKATAPRLVLTYHAVASIVIGNGSGDSDALAATYAAKSRYGLAHDSHSDDIFSYATTGEFEDWLHDKMGIPALLIELGTMSGNEFSRNQAALWSIAELP